MYACVHLSGHQHSMIPVMHAMLHFYNQQPTTKYKKGRQLYPSLLQETGNYGRNLSDINLIIINEISNVGADTLLTIHRRLCDHVKHTSIWRNFNPRRW